MSAVDVFECMADGPPNPHWYGRCDCGWRSGCSASGEVVAARGRDHLLNGCPSFASVSGLGFERSLIGTVAVRYGRENAEWVEVGHRVAEYLRGDRSVFAGFAR